MSTLVQCNSKITQISHVLKTEMKILRTGKLEDLPALLEAKQQYTSQLEKLIDGLRGTQMMVHVLPQMEKLKRLSHENSVMLRSVLNAIKSAAERVRALENQQAQVGAYHSNGTSMVIDGANLRENKMV